MVAHCTATMKHELLVSNMLVRNLYRKAEVDITHATSSHSPSRIKMPIACTFSGTTGMAFPSRSVFAHLCSTNLSVHAPYVAVHRSMKSCGVYDGSAARRRRFSQTVSYDLGMRCGCLQVVQRQRRDGLARAIISARQIQLSVHRPAMKVSNT